MDVPFIFEEVYLPIFRKSPSENHVPHCRAEKLSQFEFHVGIEWEDLRQKIPAKLSMRLINHTQALTRASLKALSLREALGTSDRLVATLREDCSVLRPSRHWALMCWGLSILAIKPPPETRARGGSARANSEAGG